MVRGTLTEKGTAIIYQIEVDGLLGSCCCSSQEDNLTHIGDVVTETTWCGKVINGILITYRAEVNCAECVRIIKQRSRPIL